ncbi:MAG TPA: glutathione peroxidase, partial [Stenotrophomonas sp.]|nr:glutathione peroxidase [Stenotrophomonas sp.]
MFHARLLSSFHRPGTRARGWAAATLLLGVVISTGAASAAGLLDLSYRPLAGKGEVNLQQQYGGKVLLV